MQMVEAGARAGLYSAYIFLLKKNQPHVTNKQIWEIVEISFLIFRFLMRHLSSCMFYESGVFTLFICYFSTVIVLAFSGNAPLQNASHFCDRCLTKKKVYIILVNREI